MLPPKADPREVAWPHAPIHRLSAKGTYFVTAGTYQKEHFFRGANRVQVLHRGLLTVAQKFGWTLEAWSVFSNHYHFVAHSPESDDNAESLSQMLGLLHEKTAKWIIKLDICKGRQVCTAWCQWRIDTLGAPQHGLSGLLDRLRLRRYTVLSWIRYECMTNMRQRRIGREES